MEIRLLACTVLMCAMTSSVFSGDQISKQRTPGSVSRPELDALRTKTDVEDKQKKEPEKRREAKQWSPPPEIPPIQTPSN